MTRRVVGPLGLRGRCTHMYLSVSALTASGAIVLLLGYLNVYTANQYPACNTVHFAEESMVADVLYHASVHLSRGGTLSKWRCNFPSSVKLVCSVTYAGVCVQQPATYRFASYICSQPQNTAHFSYLLSLFRYFPAGHFSHPDTHTSNLTCATDLA